MAQRVSSEWFSTRASVRSLTPFIVNTTMCRKWLSSHYGRNVRPNKTYTHGQTEIQVAITRTSCDYMKIITAHFVLILK